MNRLQTLIACLLGVIPPFACAQTPPVFQLNGSPVSREKLLEHYAPSVLHWHQQYKDRDKWSFLDLLMAIDFDGDRETEGNRRKAQELSREGRAYSLEPVFYADVVAATKSHLFLLYYFFHAADRGDNLITQLIALFPLGWGAHENDLEGGMLVVERETGKVVAASFLAHNEWDDRAIPKSPEGDGRLDWVVWVEG
ncbi:MAG: hypothetical protein JNL98_37130, partial [Bryobacterales bacterium]|nr:hypothetical protein [Bryobacterales bacterium]